MTNLNNKQVYIKSLEASSVWEHMERENYIRSDYVGMIPFSLELVKLQKEGLTVKTVKFSEKQFSDDIINIKFNQKVRSGEFLLEKLPGKVKELKGKIKEMDAELENPESEEGKELKKAKERLVKRKNKLDELIETIKAEKDEVKWQEVSSDDLRKQLYLDGFTIRNVNEETGEIISDVKYVHYKRSSSKSRTGQCLFIRKDMYEEMINWSRMYLPLEKDMKIDLASLMAYESLVGSSLEGTLTIDPNNILIVDDVDSKFKKIANIVKTNENTGRLDSFIDNAPIKNSLFDGESLLDKKHFPENVGMQLLRNHMFKSAAFNTNIQTFLKANCPEGIDFDTWEIPNMFNEPMLAKNIEMIITPSSLKALKFHCVIGTEKDMWNYWRGLVAKEGSIFGVCKHEKKSKRGTDNDDNILQQTSYQMLNSLPMEEKDMKKLTTFESWYIGELKNNDDTFIRYIEKNATNMNSNKMFVELYCNNKDIVHTKIFREFRKTEIKKYITNCKKGKVRLNGDYCVLLGNPLEFLYHAIGKFDVNNVEDSELALKENEIYTTMFEFGKTLTGFRNPHTSPSNVLITKNKNIECVGTYFNLTDNIVCVNAVRFELQDKLSGCDYDSDTLVLFDNKDLLNLAYKCSEYRVCINNVDSKPKDYKLNNTDMFEIDRELSKSQRYIGEVVNLGQLCMSRYWDLKEEGETENWKELQQLMKMTDVMTVLSGLCIDLAKKFYDIKIKDEIQHVKKNLRLKQETEEKKKCKPLFFKYVSESETIDERITEYNCPMDYLNKVMSRIPNAKHRENINLETFLVGGNKRKANRKQERQVVTKVDEMCGQIDYAYVSMDDKKEREAKVDTLIEEYQAYVKKKKMKPDTMHDILLKISEGKIKNATRLMNILYKTQTEVFLGAFTQK